MVNSATSRPPEADGRACVGVEAGVGIGVGAAAGVDDKAAHATTASVTQDSIAPIAALLNICYTLISVWMKSLSSELAHA